MGRAFGVQAFGVQAFGVQAFGVQAFGFRGQARWFEEGWAGLISQ